MPLIFFQIADSKVTNFPGVATAKQPFLLILLLSGRQIKRKNKTGLAGMNSF